MARDTAGVGEGVGDGGFAVLGEDSVEMLHLLDEGVLLGGPDGLGEVCDRGGCGVVVSVVLIHFVVLSVVVLVCR